MLGIVGKIGLASVADEVNARRQRVLNGMAKATSS
jgi:hypothetical protein